MNCQNLYILLVLSLLICQNSLASSVKEEGSKIEKNVENPTKSNEKSTKPPLQVKEGSKIETTVKNPTKSDEKTTKPPPPVKESSRIEKIVENPPKFNEKSTKPPLKGHLLMFHNQGTRSHLIVMSALAKALLENGYKVTTVFYAKMNIVHENYNEILIKDS